MVTLAELTGRMSPSRLETASACLAKFAFSYVERLPWRFSSSAQFGNAVDAVAAWAYGDKIKSGEAPVRADVRDRFAAEWDYQADAVDDWRDWRRGELLDIGVAGVGRWRDRIVDFVEPLAVQQKLEVEITDPIDGDRYVLNGIVDLRARVAGREVIVDGKTSEKRYPASRVARSYQPPTYSVLGACSTFEYHVQTVAKEPQVQVLRANITDSDRRSLLLRAGMIRRQIAHAFRTGDWLPNRTHFLCSRRYCDHWAACEKRFGGRVSE